MRAVAAISSSINDQGGYGQCVVLFRYGQHGVGKGLGVVWSAAGGKFVGRVYSVGNSRRFVSGSATCATALTMCPGKGVCTIAAVGLGVLRPVAGLYFDGASSDGWRCSHRACGWSVWQV